MKCIVLYITKSIRGVITDLDTAKCKYFKILVVIKVFCYQGHCIDRRTQRNEEYG